MQICMISILSSSISPILPITPITIINNKAIHSFNAYEINALKYEISLHSFEKQKPF